ncbi:MAG: hypothetical protein HC804_06255 [Anaerolineae bacterium]|nr:hypothetical protein [Anaerolineae bacterium]
MLTQLQQRQAGQDFGFYRPPSPGTAVGSTRFNFRQAVPAVLKGSGWQLQPLQKGIAALTYEAYLTNPDAPFHRNGRCANGRCANDQPYTWRDHMERVEKAEQEHHSHKQFSFAILTATHDKCLGCIHLTPLRPFLTRYLTPDHLLTSLSENSAMILFWLCRSYRDQPVAYQLIHTLHHWLADDWELDEHLFRAQSGDVTAVHTLQTAGLHLRFTLDITVTPVQYAFYGE